MLTGIQFKEAVISGANNINRRKQMVNDLNVFPVPDGDTGTNMSMTISAAVEALGNMDIGCDTGIDEVSSAVASALLRGARGNSGVILSLLFRGFAKGCRDKKEADGETVAEALIMGVESAYKAVLKPTEGTVLTVSRMAAQAAKEAAKRGADEIGVLEAAFAQGEKTLAETPEMLPILKKAGVVDAGGKGYLVILEGIIEYLKSGVGIEAGETPEFTEDGVADPEVLSEDEITFTYCTEFIVGKAEGNSKDPELLRGYLRTIGDSIVVVDDDEIIKVHVHTDHPGKAFEEALTYGMLEKTKVENMRLQFRQRKAGGSKAQKTAEVKGKAEPAEPVNDFGIVAVAAGEGLASVFSDLGCDNVVFGGQTMNPSTQDILAACMATPAKVVYVLPNNKNIIMAAEQAIPLAEDRRIVVIPTKTIPQGVASALAFDSSMPEEEITKAMTEAAGSVRTGQITFAARDSDFDGQEIKEGQILALCESKLAFTDTDVNDAARKLVCKLADDGSRFITIFFGEDVSEEQADELASDVREDLPDAEVTCVLGGQPIYHYIISVE